MRIGRRKRTVIRALPGKLRRASAYAAGTPMRADTTTTVIATWAVTVSTSDRLNSAQASPYQWVVKPSGIQDPNHVVANDERTTVEIRPARLMKKKATRPQTTQPPMLDGRKLRLEARGAAVVGPPNHGPGGAHPDQVSGLYLVTGLLPAPGPQPCSRKMRDLSCLRQDNRLWVRHPYRQHQLIPLLCESRGVLLSPQASRSNAGAAAFPATWNSACQAYSVKPSHHRKPILDSRRVP